MNENQKKTTDEYRNNYDNIFRKNKNGDKVLPVMPTDETTGRVQTSSDIEQKS